MADLNALSPSETARQLGNPEGDVGLEVGRRLNQVNKQVTEHVYDRLGLRDGMNILEIGFGNGHLLRSLLSRADGLQYDGIEISKTMVKEAQRYNGTLADIGHATFHLASADNIPMNAATMDRVFAVNVVYFWSDPVTCLREIRRVLRPAGISVIAAATPETLAATDFSRAEFGFHPRDGTTLAALHYEAGFTHVTVENYSETVLKRDGTPWERGYHVVVAEV
jgi:ubiquinone/menaquinone biosynthesis C-methylase UbiE